MLERNNSETDILLWQVSYKRLIRRFGWFVVFVLFVVELTTYLTIGPSVLFVVFLPSLLTTLAAMVYEQARTSKLFRRRLVAAVGLFAALGLVTFTIGELVIRWTRGLIRGTGNLTKGTGHVLHGGHTLLTPILRSVLILLLILLLWVLSVKIYSRIRSAYQQREAREFRRWLSRAAMRLVTIGLLVFTLTDYFAMGEGPVLWSTLTLLLFFTGWVAYDFIHRIRSTAPDRELYKLITAERQKVENTGEATIPGSPPSARDKGSSKRSDSKERTVRRYTPFDDSAEETRASWAGRWIEREVFLRRGWGKANKGIHDIYTALGPPPLRSAVGTRK